MSDKPWSGGFKVGDRVAYRAGFLRSICDYSHESASKRGTIVAMPLDILAEIDWDGGSSAARRVHVGNLWPADKIHLEPR